MRGGGGGGSGRRSCLSCWVLRGLSPPHHLQEERTSALFRQWDCGCPHPTQKPLPISAPWRLVWRSMGFFSKEGGSCLQLTAQYIECLEGCGVCVGGFERLRNLLGTPSFFCDTHSSSSSQAHPPNQVGGQKTKLPHEGASAPRLGDSGLLRRSPRKGWTTPLREGRPRAGPLGLS